MKSIEADFRNRQPHLQQKKDGAIQVGSFENYMPSEDAVDGFFERALLALASEPDVRER